MSLSEVKCKAAKPAKKPYKLSDGHGLYLEVSPNGSKYWRMKYRYLSKENRLSFGVYDKVSLKEAREKCRAAQKQLEVGINPSHAKKEAKRNAALNAQNTFEAVAREWHEKQVDRWSQKYWDDVMQRFETNVFPYIGSRPIAEIEPPELLEVLQKIETRGALYVAGRIKQVCGQVLRYGVATGKCKRDPSSDLRGALKTAKTKHYAALDIKEMPEFLQALEKNDARLFARTRRAIRLLMLTFTRTTELIHARWNEFDLENAQWEIPAERMKMRTAHIVPLSRQVMELLKEQKEETQHLNTEFVFPNQIRPINPMSNATVLVAIRNMGYGGRMTGHGFRALAMSTIKEKLGYRHEVVDRQLAHAPGNKVDRAYDRAKFLDDRREMMQKWADYMDAVASDNKVIVAQFDGKAREKKRV